MYQFGHGLPQNSAESARLYLLAAQQGHIRATVILGYLYSEGIGVQRDEAEAVRWLQQAAQEDYSEAQFLLGQRYLNGSGVPLDLSEAEAVPARREQGSHGPSSTSAFALPLGKERQEASSKHTCGLAWLY